MTGAALNTVMKLLRDLGPVCAAYQDDEQPVPGPLAGAVRPFFVR